MRANKNDQFNFLKKILTRNSLVEPNGQPLFQYQLIDQDYRELLSILRQYPKSPSKGDLDKTYCALFCLYVSEWFRRDYNGGWTWEPIWSELGYSIGQADRGYLVFKGLAEYWSRPVSQYSDDRRSLLGSVFREGGLPFRLLSGEGNRVQEVFRCILKNIDSARLLGRSTYDLTKSHLNSLPEAFHQETTVELVADMSEKLIHLVDRYQLSDQEEPARYLDSQFQNWRRLFPIPLDEHVGTAFLNALLLSATKNRVTRAQLEPVSCIHTQLKCEAFQLKAYVELAESIPLPINRDQLTSGRVELYVYEGLLPIASLGVAYIRFEGANAVLNPRSRACEFKRQDMEKSLWIIIKHAGQTIYQIEVPESELNISAMPIGLVMKDDEWVVCGSGSFSKRSTAIRLVLPKGAKCDAANARINEEGFIEEYRCMLFSGVICVDVDEDRYRISNTSDVGFENLVRINGPTLPFSSASGQPIYLGFPKIESTDAQAHLWVSGRRYSSAEPPVSALGYHTIKLKTSDGTTLLCKGLAILPADFKVSLIPGSGPGEGAIQLASTVNFVASVRPHEGLTSSQKKDAGNKLIQLKISGSPPATITVSITANLEAKPISILLPFPAQGILAFDRHNNRLPRELILDDLLGSRLVLYPKLNGSQKYLLEFISNTKFGTARFDWAYCVSEAPLEISLYEMRGYISELFSIKPDDLDANVNIRIAGDTIPLSFIVKRYACETVIDNRGIAIISRGHNGNIDAIPVVMDLADPKSKPRLLTALETEGVPTGYYGNVSLSKTTKLIVPSPESPIHFRARLIPAEKEVDWPSDSRSLYTAVTYFHSTDNPFVIQNVVDQMGKQFDHSGWQYIHDLFQNYQYLPLTTFHVWREIAKSPNALALLAFRLEDAVSIVDRLQEEFNVLWDWIPIDVWMYAFQCFNDHWGLMGLPEEAKNAIIKNRFEQLSKCIFLFRKELEHLVLGQASPNRQPPNLVMNMLINDWYQDLMRTHQDNNRWPADYSSELFRWYESLNEKIAKINVCRGYQKSVVCLPIFAAAVVSGNANLMDVFEDAPMARFTIRKIAEFDRQWFFPVYHYCLEAQSSKG